MVVPNDNEATRTWTLSEGNVRTLRNAVAVVALFGMVGVGAVVTPLGRVGVAIAAGTDPREAVVSAGDPAVELLRNQLAALQDTLASIGRREEQLRLIAGLPPKDSAPEFAAVGVGTPNLASASVQSQAPAGARPFGQLGLASADLDGMIRVANALSASFAEINDTVSSHKKRMESTPSIMPTTGWLTSHFSRSRFHPVLHVARAHEGIDVSAPMGSPIVAPANGVVRRVARETGYGNVLEIDHGNGITTKYAHTSRIFVRQGQRVTRGEKVAAVGNSGLSTGPHLHYEIHVNGRVVDPLTYVLPGAIPD